MTHSNARSIAGISELNHEATTQVGGGMINLREERPIPPIDPGHGGMDTPYWATGGAMRYGAGPWDYGYGSPTGPWPG
jgi:hypothetical protein